MNLKESLQLTYLDTGRHGYVSVKLNNFLKNNTEALLKDISGDYSYAENNKWYLEEDLDAPKFLSNLATLLEVESVKSLIKSSYSPSSYETIKRLPSLKDTLNSKTINIDENIFLLTNQKPEELQKLFQATNKLPEGTVVGELGDHAAEQERAIWEEDMIHETTDASELDKLWNTKAQTIDWWIRSSTTQPWFKENYYSGNGIMTGEIDWESLNELFKKHNIDYSINHIELDKEVKPPQR